ncbi:unnamed protein product [Spirodela intermedia]|uniref:Uncharacterized protein n=1 Tax=Spirodela intermedia TaxID=51605 RepID=A0A7I8KG69_SPIIN|nr:unnamed protein product [Spirodela intermedia]
MPNSTAICLKIRWPSSTSPPWAHAESRAMKVTSSGSTPRRDISSNRARASPLWPWAPSPQIMVVHEITHLIVI